ncbi:resolvase [Carnobacterium divergens]|uniref:Resolvase n=1 Tax=Carnobacterium divergens DSM 20623 TaxID=1449336 RepID=A0A0R2I4T4_CARDV|nr:recombinase family protein [Carnobacterium divergens]ANZ99305.1 resolvase [Carnobacterium divergens]KRN57228.1 resolvase [Carnobacterium divergens DSM 20623]MDO0875685.1 recombinase family protein [Carnobacterium divergens]MDT1995727.1 recombinase family protein [Carnobacterium divergens]MDT2011726.1 recombinase family protein [Carnobacterium divergens]
MKTIGYARISTSHQQLDAQINALTKYGCDKIFTEQESGRKTKRRQLDKAIASLEKGDTFVIFKLDRLSRGTKHLLSLMEFFNEAEINFVSIQNNIDTSTSMGKFFFTIMSAFAEMEAELIRERVLSGLEAAKEKGITLGRPIENKNLKTVIDQYMNTDLSITEIAKLNQISRPTVYNYLKRENIPKRSKIL